MKKFLVILLIFFPVGCSETLMDLHIVPSTVTSEGKRIEGEVGSMYWEEEAPKQDVMAWYNSKSVIDLCMMWEDVEGTNWQPFERLRKNNIGESLHSRGYDYMYCDNPAKRKEKELKREVERERYETKKAKEEAKRADDDSWRLKKENERIMLERKQEQDREIRRRNKEILTEPALE